MNKYCLLTIAFIIICLNLSAQTSKFEYGFQGGININSAGGKNVDKDHRGLLTGLSVGGHIKVKATDHFGVKLLLAYDENGYSFRRLTFENSTGTGLVNGDVFTHLNFLNLPLLAEYTFGNRILINLDAGAFLGVLLNSKSVTKFKDPLPPGQPASISSPVKAQSVNYGIAIGFGLQVPVATDLKIDFDIRNNTGLNLFGTPNSGQGYTNCLSVQTGITVAF